MKIPIKLGTDTIIEAIVEIRFQGTEAKTGALLPGILYSDSHIKEQYPRMEELPAAQIPQVVMESDPNFEYAATHKMSGESLAIQIGRKSISMSCKAPYIGWDNFRKEIEALIGILLQSDLLTNVERVSLRCINLLEMPIDEQVHGLEKLRTKITLTDHDLVTDSKAKSTYLRTELLLNDCTNIIQLFWPSKLLRSEGKELHGTIVDVDTIKETTISEFTESYSDLLNVIHDTEKNIFFPLLTQKTLEELEPMYE